MVKSHKHAGFVPYPDFKKGVPCSKALKAYL
jgi:hypothetical protein